MTEYIKKGELLYVLHEQMQIAAHIANNESPIDNDGNYSLGIDWHRRVAGIQYRTLKAVCDTIDALKTELR